MRFEEVLPLALLSLTLGMQILHSFWFRDCAERSIVILPRLKAVFWGGAILALFFVFRQIIFLYEAWRLDRLARLFLPPYRSWTYFAEYAGSRIFAPWVIGFAAALIGFAAARALNRRYGERFFEPEEPLLFACAILFTGYPVLLFYGVLLGVAALLWVAAARTKGIERAPLYFLWLPAALIAILIVYRFVPADALARFTL